MFTDEKEIQKYIFDPKNPKQCKSYKLLLNIAKKEPLVYVSSDFVTIDYEKEILQNDFNEELWDLPENYEELNVLEKINVFKELLSEKDYLNYIKKLEINEDSFSYKKIFQNFVDFTKEEFFESIYYQNKKYNKELLKIRLQSLQEDCNSRINKNIYSPKIFFDNDYFSYLKESKEIFDVASVLVTELKNKNVFEKYNVHKNLKPLFLENIDDIKILLNVLQQDLKKEASKEKILVDIYTLESVKIKNFFSIKNIELQNLENKKEIYVVGENGDGKTLFLQALALGLKGVDDGEVFNLVKSQKEYEISLLDANKNEFTSTSTKEYKNFFAYGANRNSNCQLKEDEKGYLTLFNSTLDLKNPIEWLKYIDHSEKSEKSHLISSSMAKKLLQDMLHSDVNIEISPDSVTFTEKGSHVTFEQLSAGYTGVITIVVDLLVRLSENQSHIVDISEFRGVVVIDEVELHLHPKWKYDFVKKLRSIFPNIQFIMTTHSPTVILGASKEAVFYKIYKEDGEVHISNQIENEGYTNNSLISSPLFDLKSVASRDYKKPLSNDDYIYEQIHEKISEEISLESLEEKERVSKLIDEELAKI